MAFCKQVEEFSSCESNTEGFNSRNEEIKFSAAHVSPEGAQHIAPSDTQEREPPPHVQTRKDICCVPPIQKFTVLPLEVSSRNMLAALGHRSRAVLFLHRPATRVHPN